jgi:hypothetical protein
VRPDPLYVGFIFFQPTKFEEYQLFDDLQKKAVSFLSENASAFLTAGGVIGTVGTAVLTGRAAFKAAEIINQAETDRYVEDASDFELSKTDKVKLVGVQFAPPMLLGLATIAAIIMANRMSAQRAAALAAAYGISQKNLEEYKHKLEEKLGTKKATDIRDAIQQDRVNESPPNKQIVIIGNGEVLCFDAFSGRYFKSTVDYIKRAEAVVNREIIMGNECSLSVFYDELDLPQISLSTEVGWNINHTCEVQISTVMSPDEQPCLCIEFAQLPIMEYRIRY